MHVQSSGQEARYPVRHVPEMGGYLSVSADVRRVRDGDMVVTFDLANLPFREEPRAGFTQTFVVSQPPTPIPPGAVAEPVGDGWAGLRRLPPVVPQMAHSSEPDSFHTH